MHSKARGEVSLHHARSERTSFARVATFVVMTGCALLGLPAVAGAALPVPVNAPVVAA